MALDSMIDVPSAIEGSARRPTSSAGLPEQAWGLFKKAIA